MAKNDTSEEKTLPPSPKKLRDLRKKGQIARSTDMVTGVATTGAALYLVGTASGFSRDFEITTRVVFDLQNAPFELAASEALAALGVFVGLYLAGLSAVVAGCVIIANVIVNKGFLFSLDPMKLSFDKLNPIEGFQRLVSVRSAVELVKISLKAALLVSLCLIAMTSGLQAIFSIPFCGVECVGPILGRVATPMIVIAIAILLFAGIIDVAVQTWLFRRDQRMSKTEAKRERKDEEGSPEVRTAQKRQRSRFLQTASHYTEEDATIFIEGHSVAVGLRFVRNETPLPVIVCKGRGEQAARLLAAAQGRVAIHFDDEFASGLAQRAELGGTLPEAYFPNFIKALQETGQL
jgi:type III secretion protein U